MSRLNASAVMTRALDLIDGVKPRSFLDASEIEPPAEWANAPRARIAATPAPVAAGIEVQEAELVDAEVHVVYALFCKRCARRHMETRSSYMAGQVYVCRRCQAPNRLPVLPP